MRAKKTRSDWADLEIPLGKRSFKYRVLEILPGALSYSMILLLFVLSWVSPMVGSYYLLLIIAVTLVYGRVPAWQSLLPSLLRRGIFRTTKHHGSSNLPIYQVILRPITAIYAVRAHVPYVLHYEQWRQVLSSLKTPIIRSWLNIGSTVCIVWQFS